MTKSATQSIIDLFGGIRPTARKLNIPVTTVQGWVKRDMIPLQRFDDIESFALHHNLGGQILPLLNELKKAAVASEAGTEQEIRKTSSDGVKSSFTAKPAAPSGANILNDGNFIPKPLPHYSFQPEKRMQSAGAFTVSIISAVLAVIIIVILFFAPDILPINRDDGRTAAYEEQNRIMAEQFEQYRKSVDTVADRLYDLAKTTQSIQNELASVKAASVSDNAGTEEEKAAREKKIVEIEKTLTDLKGSNDQLRTMVNRMEHSYAADGDAGALPEIKKMVEDVNSKLSVMQNDISGNKPEDVSAADDEIMDDALTMSDTVKTDEKSMASLVKSAGGINEAFRNGGEFGTELAIISTLMGNNSAIAELAIKLEPYSKSGIPRTSDIAQTLKLLSGDIVAASDDYRNMSVADRAKYELDKLISIRKDGTMPEGETSAAIVKRASIYLDAGQIEAARAELMKLDPEAARVALPVTEKIEANEVAIEFVNQLETAMKEYIPAEYMNGIITPWLNATRDAAMLKFQDPRTIKAPVPKYLNNSAYKLHLTR